MSTSPHSESAHATSSHDFDGEPVRELAPDEPRTPLWVPALGLLLFVAVAIVGLVSSDDTPSTTPATAADVPNVPPTAEPGPPLRPAPAPPPVRPAPPTGSAPMPGSGIQRLTKEQMEEIRKRIERGRPNPNAPQPPSQPAH